MKRQVFILVILLATLTAVQAQDLDVLKVQVDLVTVNVAVTDRAKRPITGLQASDFRVVEEGLPVELEFVDSDGPASIVFVIDSSSSMGNDRWKKLRGGLKKFLAKAREDNDYSLIAFGDQAQLLAHGVNSSELWLTFNKLEPTGNTALYDGVVLGLDALKFARQRRRALVVLSDGQDNRSRRTLLEVQRDAAARRATIYSIGVRASNAHAYRASFEVAGEEILERLASATGGLSNFPDPNDIPDVLAKINADINSQYTLGYYARGEAPGLRSLEISIVSSRHPLSLRYQQRYLKR
jgi:Ca-activated chloride channel homolog